MHARTISSRPRGALRRALPALACVLWATAAHGATTTVDAFLIKWLAADASHDAQLPSPERRTAIANALGTGFVVAGTTRDGALRIELSPPLPIDRARAALNRVRLDAGVLYANIAPDLAAERLRGSPKAGAVASPPTDRIIVKYKEPGGAGASASGSVPSQALLDRMTALAGSPVAFVRLMHDGANVLRLFQRLPIAEVEAIAARIALQPDVEFAQPDYIDQIAAFPNDPCYPVNGLSQCSGALQWDLFEAAGGVNMQPAWDITTGVSDLFIAVVDTGALFNHPDLAGRFIGGYDMVISSGVVNSNDGNNRDPDPSDPGDWTLANQCGTGTSASNSSWHGSHVAGTIGASANNGAGVAGINWVSRMVPVRVLGQCGGFSSDIADGMAWASGAAIAGVPANPNPARVLNLSVGGFRAAQTCDSVYQTAINTVLARNAVIAIAAGNSNQSASFSTPGNCNGIITVAATGRSGGRASYSNFGSLVEIAAPGGDFNLAPPNSLGILSTISSGATVPGAFVYAQYYGTSMATPHVAGIASLMLSVRPSLTPAQVLSKIQTTARAFPAGTGTDCTTSICGAGIINAGAAVLSAAGTVSTTSLGSSANPANAGSTVTFTATVTANAPTGTVRFVDGYAVLAGCGAVALSGAGNARTATCATSALGAGNHAVAAEYSGDAINGASRSPTLAESISVGAVSTTTALASSANPAPLGTTVVLTATVTGSNPTGNVAFVDADVPIAGCGGIALAGSGNARQAVCNAVGLGVGAHSIVASYGGDAGNLGSASAALSQTISPAGSSTSLASSANPAPVGTTVTFTATVAGLAPTGSVAFLDGAAPIAGCTTVALSGSGNSRAAACATAALNVGTHSISASYGGDSSNGGSSSNVLSEVVVTVATARKSRDFNGDAITDVLWYDATGGTTTLWLMNGVATSGTTNLPIASGWTPTHTGFFDADNNADILWHNDVPGATMLWRMNGTTVLGAYPLLSSNVWSVSHVADFSGDGKADLLWHNSATGDTAMWIMDLDVTLNSAKLNASAPWTVTHVADFDGDGRADLVWRNDTTGETAIWLMNGTTYLSGAIVLSDANWRVTHTGDFNGDGKADLLWRNAATGETALWLMNGTTYLSGAIVVANAQWSVTHVGDFDGDGRTDLVWRNAVTGETAIWLMNGASLGTGAIILTDPQTAVVQIGDFNGDGRSDLIFRNAATGQHTLWLMNGLTTTGTATLPIGTAFTVVP